MSNIEISRELAETLLKSAGQSGHAKEKEALQKLLYPEPVTVKDYMDAGRGEEIKPGMWVEKMASGLLHILFDVDTPFCWTISPTGVAYKMFTKDLKPRFDLRPAFNPDGKPFPIVDVELEQEQEQPEAPKGGLFGKWANHPKYGKVLVIQDTPNKHGYLIVSVENHESTKGFDSGFVPLSSLTFDPATLTTEQDYADAPNGTIVEAVTGAVYVKDREEWCRDDVYLSNSFMFGTTRKIVRWGRA